jgi:co-chaperonin GroES (HSP10)
MPQLVMQYDYDPAEKLIGELGDLSGIKMMNTQILIAVHMRPNKTQSGMWLPENHMEEDRFQGKSGLLIAAGPQAFHQDGKWFQEGINFEIGKTWILFRPSDGWNVTINGKPCRMLDDVSIRAVVNHPDMVF